MTDKKASFPAYKGPFEPNGMLARDGTGKTIVCDAAVFAYGVQDAFLDFLLTAEEQGYRVVLQSKSPTTDLNGFLKRWIQGDTRFQTFMETHPVLLTGSPHVNRGQEPYLRVTHENNFKVNEWSPIDRRIDTSMLLWLQAPIPTGDALAAEMAFRQRAMADVMKRLRREGLKTSSILAQAQAEAGIDRAEFHRRVQAQTDYARGLGPKPKPKP